MYRVGCYVVCAAHLTSDEIYGEPRTPFLLSFLSFSSQYGSLISFHPDLELPLSRGSTIQPF